jgi:hypothetical protein
MQHVHALMHYVASLLLCTTNNFATSHIKTLRREPIEKRVNGSTRPLYLLRISMDTKGHDPRRYQPLFDPQPKHLLPPRPREKSSRSRLRRTMLKANASRTTCTNISHTTCTILKGRSGRCSVIHG